jgi:hypothetical protein
VTAADPVARAELAALRASLDEMRAKLETLAHMLRPDGVLVAGVLQERLQTGQAVMLRLAALEERMRSAEERLARAERPQ